MLRATYYTSFLVVLCVFSFNAFPSHLENTANQSINSDYQHLKQRLATLEEKVTAQDQKLQVDGFISASFARSDDDSTTENWGGITDKNDFGALSSLGIQLSFAPNKKTAIVTQFVSRGEEQWDTQSEWAYLAINVSDQLKFRIGRQKAPLYLLSEYIEVGYVYPWICAPDEVYGITGDSTYDGATILYTIFREKWDTTLQLMWGNNAFSHQLVGDVSLDDLTSLSLTFQQEFTTLRVGYTLVDGNIPELSFSLPAIPNTPVNTGDSLSFAATNSDISYLSAGFVFDNDRILIMSEYAQLEIKGWFTDTRGTYLMTGYRLFKFMPHFTVAKMEVLDEGARNVGTITSSTGDALTLPSSVIGAVADALLVQNQSTYTLGLRYDFLPSVSFKMELSQITDFKGTTGQFSAKHPPTTDEVHILKLSIDAVF